jgi:hypothetical protein
MLTLNKNGFLASTYRWFYRTMKLPESLCPYFWKLLTALILGPFKIFFNIPFMVAFESPRVYFQRHADAWSREDENVQSLVGWVILFLSLCILSTISVIFNGLPHKDGSWWFMVTLGIVLIAVGIISGICYLVWLLHKNIKNKLDDDRQEGFTPAIDVISEFTRSTINKYCPQIKWK